MTSSGPEPARSGSRVDLGRLHRADCLVAAGTVLYLLFLALPWFSVDAFDLGSGFRSPGVSANGFDSGLLVLAAVLLVLATVWALLPAFAEVPAPSPRALPTAALAALAVVLTLVEWLSDLDLGFALMGLLALLSAIAVLVSATVRLLAEVLGPGSLPGRLGRVVRSADRSAFRSRPTVPGPPQPTDGGEPAGS
jgi:hypothetical protein